MRAGAAEGGGPVSASLLARRCARLLRSRATRSARRLPPLRACVRAQVACLQCVPAITITNGIPTTFLPLSIVLGFDGVVTALEDYKRHKNDARANSSTSAL